MSRQAILDLLAKADTDEVVRQDLDAVLEGTGDRTADFLTVARKHGFEFTAEEFGQVVMGLMNQAGELSDDELQGVAGGFVIGPDQVGKIDSFTWKWTSAIGPRIMRGPAV